MGEEPANVALAWLLNQPAVAAPIIGPRTIEQLNNTMRVLEIKFDQEILTKINAIFPGFKTSPEHYAW
jgi:aryl-alcohol dehydrogenase-like predicted oxidoreductase